MGESHHCVVRGVARCHYHTELFFFSLQAARGYVRGERLLFLLFFFFYLQGFAPRAARVRDRSRSRWLSLSLYFGVSSPSAVQLHPSSYTLVHPVHFLRSKLRYPARAHRAPRKIKLFMRCAQLFPRDFFFLSFF